MAFKIYTKTGDKGQTSLFGGKRLPKDDIRIEAYGTVDELNANIGLVHDVVVDEHSKKILKTVQDRLFTIGSILATDPEKQAPVMDIYLSDVEILERAIDEMETELPALTNFILPGGHPTVSYCHLARCVCRRAERRVISLTHQSPVEAILPQYLNRLSDYLFVLGRYQAKILGVEELIWEGRKGKK